MDTPTSHPHPHVHENETGFWHYVAMVIGTVFGLSALVLGVSFVVVGIAGPKSLPQATAAPILPGSGTPQEFDFTIKPSPGNPMAYDTTSLTVKAGGHVKITFLNQSAVPLPHNLCICQPGSKDAMMAEINKFMTDPTAAAKDYIPDTSLILWHTKLVQPGQAQTIDFIAPAAGDYPYLCTFPGHAIIMNGVMKVE
jgi:azurin